MQRINWIDRALLEWATWRMAGGGGYRSPDYEIDPGDQRSVSCVEISADQEASALQMDAAVAQLPRDLRKTVVAHYTWEGGMDQVTRLLHVTRATVHRRLCQADIRILAWLDAVAAHRDHKK